MAQKREGLGGRGRDDGSSGRGHMAPSSGPVVPAPGGKGARSGRGKRLHRLARHRLRFLESLRQVGPLVRIRLGAAPVYVVTDPALVHQVQSSKGRSFGRGKQFQRMVPLLGHGVITSDGELYHRQRRTLQKAFTPAHVERHLVTIHRQAEKLCASWEEGRPVDVLHAMKGLSVAVTAETLFSGRLTERVLSQLSRVLPVVEKAAVERPMMPKVVDRLPLPFVRRGDEAMARMRAVVQEAVAACRGQTPRSAGDMVACLLAARDPDTGRPLSDDLVCDEVIAMLIGGVANVPATLAWAWFHLALRPGAEERMLTEIGDPGGGPLTTAELERLPYTRAVMYETTRLHSVQLVTQRTTAAVELGGVMLPCGTDTAYSRHSLHAFVPFGGGRFKCIGDNFACAEMMATPAAAGGGGFTSRPACGWECR
ncbi:cytochrome P450 [Streptomyces netropsis]